MIDFIKSFYENKCAAPQNFLGLHLEKNEKVVRFFLPDHEKGYIFLKGDKKEAQKIDECGIFQCIVPYDTNHLDYQILYPFGSIHDPYGFASMINPLDIELFTLGVHYELYELLGAHICEQKQVVGTRFIVWAPHAFQVSVKGDFNLWDGRVFPMRCSKEGGLWEIFLPISCKGQKYKFDLYTQEGHLKVKTDPFGFAFEKRPHTAAIVSDHSQLKWEDQEWMDKENRNDLAGPINIYEVHLGSWKVKNQDFVNYRELAHELVTYCQEMGYTHIELLPIMEHPLDESWGYQVSGFFAPTSRYGSLEDFHYFVNYIHKHHIGVILDWVPGHFPLDDFSLNRFDGTCLYECEDPLMGYHPQWSTAIFNYASKQVSNFLIASALYWLKTFHIDGFRVDAVASLIYLDYGREKGKWKPNIYGNNYNLEAIEFLKHLNTIIHKRYPHTLMIAEESSSYEKVTYPTQEGGLGFDLKWKMGWMNDTLSFMSTDPLYRKFKHEQLTFSMWYAQSEKFILPLSHDEVVHEKRSLLEKLNADPWIQFANLRLLLSYMICHPGKNLLFMGAEIAQRKEWNCKGEINWDLLKSVEHASCQLMVKELNHFYLQQPPLWQFDFEEKGFEWVIVDDKDRSILCYKRISESSQLICIHNFTPIIREKYLIPLPVQQCKEVFNTDLSKYGGSNQKNESVECRPDGFLVALPPMATLIFEAR